MAELILIKQTETDVQSPMEHVVGVKLLGARTVWGCAYLDHDNVTEESLISDDSVIKNIADFYERTIGKYGEIPYYNCHTFAGYTAGLIDDVRPCIIDYGENANYQSIAADMLEPGKAYTIDSDGTFMHSIVGLNRPDYSLGVRGNSGPLVVAKNTDLVQAYGGSSIVTTPNTLESPRYYAA